jgi:hypothetical protein
MVCVQWNGIKLVDDFIFQKQQSANEKKTANGKSAKSAKKTSANSNQQIF